MHWNHGIRVKIVPPNVASGVMLGRNVAIRNVSLDVPFPRLCETTESCLRLTQHLQSLSNLFVMLAKNLFTKINA